MTRLFISALAFALCLGAAAHAFMAGDPQAGRILAVDHCVACHTIPAEAVAAADSGAPGFDAMAADENAYTLKSMRASMNSPHWPDGSVTLSSEDADNVLAFIVSLRNE